MRHRQDYTKQIVIRCTVEERARWKALAERLEATRRDTLRQRGHSWVFTRRDEEITLSTLVRQLLDARDQASPAPKISGRRRHTPAAAAK